MPSKSRAKGTCVKIASAEDRAAIFTEVCNQIAEGKSLISIVDQDGMPSYRAILGWIAADPAYQQQYETARVSSADADADRIGHIVDGVLAGKTDPMAARVAIDALKWTSARRSPKKYSEKFQHVHSGAIAVERVVVEFASVDVTPHEHHASTGAAALAEAAVTASLQSPNRHWFDEDDT